MGRVTISELDRSLEPTRMTLRMTDLTAANFDAQITAAGTLQAAIQGVSLIDFDGITYLALETPREETQPTSVYAQREAKWLITMADDVNERLNQFEIGGPDLTLAGSDGKTLDVSGGAGATLVTQLEANAISRDGNAMTFVVGVHVGRNN